MNLSNCRSRMGSGFHPALLALAVVACTDRKSEPTKEPPAPAKKKAEPPAASPLLIEEDKLGSHLPFFDEAEIVRRLQGSWVFDTGIHNVPVAWHFKDREFFSLAADDETTMPRNGVLQLLAPCRVAHVEKTGVKTFTNYRNVVVTDDGIFLGSSMGERRGSDFVVCTQHGIFSGNPSDCVLWQPSRDDSLSGTRASCRFERDEQGAEHFVGKFAEQNVRVPVYGDLVSTWPLDECRARKVSGLAEAIKAVEAKP